MSFASARGVLAALASGACLVGAATAAPVAKAADPGRLLHAESVRVSLPGARADAWRISYRSQTADGAPDIVSGSLVVPASPARRRGAVVALGVGSQGLADGCAPSRNLNTGLLLEAPLVALMVNRGWSVVIPDGEGLGSPGVATYAVGRSAGHAMLDAVRAARELPAGGVLAQNPVALLGYSEGGGSVAWAAQQQPRYAPDVPLVGAAAGGSMIDLAAFVHAGLANGAIAAAVSALVGLQAADPALPLASFLTPAGRFAAGVVRSTCIYPAIALLAPLTHTPLLRADPLVTPAWSQRAALEIPGATAPAAPVLLFHGLSDTTVPLAPVERLRAQWCATGARVQWLGLHGDHVAAMLTGDAAALTWVAPRLAGRPAAGNCS